MVVWGEPLAVRAAAQECPYHVDGHCSLYLTCHILVVDLKGLVSGRGRRDTVSQGAGHDRWRLPGAARCARCARAEPGPCTGAHGAEPSRCVKTSRPCPATRSPGSRDMPAVLLPR